MNVKLEFKIVGLVVVALLLGALSIGFVSIKFMQTDMNDLVDAFSDETIDFMKHAIEETMVTGNSEITSALTKKKEDGDIKSITILNPVGQVAFDSEGKSSPEDMAVVAQVRESGATVVQRFDEINTYYVPLIKDERCMKCHDTHDEVLGVLKVAISVKGTADLLAYRTRGIALSLVIGILLLGTALWIAFKRAVIDPVKELQKAAHSLAGGDFSFNTNIRSRDEIGMLNDDMRDAIRGIGNILQRIGAVAKRVKNVSISVEKESKKVAEGTQLETEATDNMISGIEEFNRSVLEIADNVSGLSVSSEETAASVDEMSTNAEEITKNTIELSSAVETTSSSIEEMSANIKEIALKTEGLSASAEETLSAIEEINSSVKEIESNARESAKLSEKVTEDASGFGMESISKTEEGMDRIKSTVQKTAEFIGKLGGRSEEIGKILNVIDEITDQTALLALNAAILAAQAGEHGKGFSVVADEIKDLAERTSYSTQEISSLIQAVQQEVQGAVSTMGDGLKTVEEGTRLSRESRDALQKIIDSSRRSTEMASYIENATSEQTKGIRFVTDAMEKVKDMIGQIARATTEQNRGTALMITASEKIRDITKHVKNSTIEQASGGKQINKAVEDVSVRIHEISDSLEEQKKGSASIMSAIEKIRDIPEMNRTRAFSMNRSLRNLLKDADLLMTELGKFRFAASRKEAAVLKMGVVPLESPAEMYKRFTPLSHYLAETLGKQVELKIAVNFSEACKEIGTGITNICYMTPSTYIEAHAKYEVEVLVKALRKGKPFHHTAIIVRDDGKINSVEGIKGRSFAFGDERSTSSHIVPRAMLLEAGIDLKDLSFYDYLGQHDDVAKAVAGGEFDAGGVMESTAEKFKKEGIKILKYSIDIPEFNLCVNKDMPDDEKALIKKAFLNLDEGIAGGSEILHAISRDYTGLTNAEDSDYDIIREMMRKIGLL